ncbi:hypothetical protein BpHYR1_027140 [Brachionus plicatilis]|uniref:Uncharacterized protein n=1 Tax=Brachionus plicatilis TaxID=10195 RepID=A0A3M7PGG0_BRAPC|nr:hypothetical protein BpHYR1_027140 [Brachionus plicatilis]
MDLSSVDEGCSCRSFDDSIRHNSPHFLKKKFSFFFQINIKNFYACLEYLEIEKINFFESNYLTCNFE